ncbi:putative alginate O-acetylase [Kerstersia similis]
MVFTSLEFLTLFLPLFLILYRVARARWRNVVLLIGSWIFYAWWSPVFLLLLVGVTLLAWGGGLGLNQARVRGSERVRRYGLVLLLVALVGLLAWFKYANILAQTASSILVGFGAMPLDWQRVVLPVGLSFFVLQAVSYLVDVQRGTIVAQRSFVHFGAYIAMFGQLIAGPIIRYDWVSRELLRRDLNWANFRLGARRFMVGMSMKVLIADTLAPIVDLAFSLPAPSLADAWLGCIAYALQLFFDFAGYSAMAIGLGVMLGFHFPENFNHPYLARSIQDFWRRWHLSLSSWIRDYLYIPMGGSRGARWKTYRNLLLSMAIAGLWHGADSWNFLFWGVAHGLALCVARLWGEWRAPALPGWLARCLTLLFVCLAWTLFRASDFDAALNMYLGQFGGHGLAPGAAMWLALRPVHALAMFAGVSCIVLPLWQDRLTQRFMNGAWGRTLRGAWPLLAFLFAFGLMASRGATPFLYFQF